MKSVVKICTLAATFLLPLITSYAQTGVSVTPPRLYFEKNPGESGTHKISVNNVSKDKSLDLSLSLGDWEYDSLGNNEMLPIGSLKQSCAKWITIKNEDNYFSLTPGEKREIEISITQPVNEVDFFPVKTAILYITQMNPYDDTNEHGANIKVGVRSGVKIYFRNPVTPERKIEIYNMQYNKSDSTIGLSFENKSNIWTDGKIYTELHNINTGEKITIPHIIYYTLPGDKRYVSIKLPKELKTGKYVASVIMEFGVDNNVEVAELNFKYE